MQPGDVPLQAPQLVTTVKEQNMTKANVLAIDELLLQLEDSSSAEAIAIADALRTSLDNGGGDLEEMVTICASFQNWARKAKAVLQKRRRSL